MTHFNLFSLFRSDYNSNSSCNIDSNSTSTSSNYNLKSDLHNFKNNQSSNCTSGNKNTINNSHKLNASLSNLSKNTKRATTTTTTTITRNHNNNSNNLNNNINSNDFQKFMLSNAQEAENILLPDVYENKKNKSKTKLKNFFSEKVFTGSSIKYKVKSGSSSSIHLIEELQQNQKPNVKTLSAKGTDLLVNNIYNKLSSRVV